VIKGFPSSPNRGVDILGASFRILSNDGIVGRTAAFKSLSGSGRDLLAVDPELVMKRGFRHHDLVTFELRGTFLAK
jgi:hypothetical protein